MRIGGYCSFAAALLAAGPLVADTVHLTNGDTLSGVVVEQAGGMVVLDHPLLGPITLPAAQVASITPTPAPPPVEAASAAVEPDQGAAPQPQTPPGPPAIATTPQTAPPPIAPVERGLLGTGLFAGWDSSFAAGFTGSSGNSDTLAINAQFKTKYEDKRDRWLWDTTYFLSEDDGEKSRNEFKSQLTKDWLIPESPWFYFAQATYEYDQFQDWKHRASGFGGVGYTFVNTDKLEFNGRLGAGLTKEFSGGRDLTPEALVGATLVRYKITPNQNLTGSLTVYPSLSQPGEYRSVAGIEYQVAIDHADGLSLKLGIENEYESETSGDAKHNDLKYYGALVYDF